MLRIGQVFGLSSPTLILTMIYLTRMALTRMAKAARRLRLPWVDYHGSLLRLVWGRSSGAPLTSSASLKL